MKPIFTLVTSIYESEWTYDQIIQLENVKTTSMECDSMNYLYYTSVQIYIYIHIYKR